MGAVTERVGEHDCIGRAALLVDTQGQAHGLTELRRDGGVQLFEGRRRLALLLERELGQRVRLVGQAAGQQLVGDDAERVDVGPGPGVLAAGLLGREVGGGAQHRADLRDARLVRGARNPEVGQLDHVGV